MTFPRNIGGYHAYLLRLVCLRSILSLFPSLKFVFLFDLTPLVLADVSKIALPADGLVCAHVTREHCRSLADVRVLTTDVILERRALDGSVVAERTLVGSEARVAHFVAAERVVVTGAIRTDIATAE